MRVIACFAATLDGKIGSSHNLRDRVGSKADLDHLLNVRNQADAILCGGGTFREYKKVRRGSHQTTPAQTPLQCVMTRDFNLPPEAGLFSADPPVPTIIFSPTEAPLPLREKYPSHVEWLATPTAGAEQVAFILDTLQARGIQTLMVEGGGHIMNLFLEARAVHELYLTVCPLLLGGTTDPSLVTGPGFAVPHAPRCEILELEKVENELYLHLALSYPAEK